MKRRKFLQQSVGIAGAISVVGNNAVLSSDKKTGKKHAALNNPPNILFIMTDQQRADCMGVNNNPIIQTPNLDALARRSANFSHAFVQSPVCTPSRACFFTGRYAHAHKNRVNYTSLNKNETLMPKYLQNAGYQTAIVGKSHLYYNYPPTTNEARQTGFDTVELHDGTHSTDPFSDYFNWRQTHDPQKEIYYREYAKNISTIAGKLPPGSNPFRAAIDKEYTDTGWTGLRTRHYLKKFASEKKPFFLFSSFWKPHSPFEVSAPFDSMYNHKDIPLPKKENRENIQKLPPHLARLILRDEFRNKKAIFDMDEERLQWIYRSYYGSISHIDQEVGLILKALENLGLAENTIIVYASDHGDQLLEHGLMGKNVFYESSVRVPLILSYPGHIKPGQYNDLVMSIDVLPTLFGIIGLEEPYNCQGQNLVPLIGKSDSSYKTRDCVFSENVIPEVFANTFNLLPIFGCIFPFLLRCHPPFHLSWSSQLLG